MDTQQLRQLKPKLRKFLSQFDDCFLRKDTRAHLPTYVAGQLSSLQDKSVEPIALKAGVAPRTLQEFLSQLKWDQDKLRDRLQDIVRTEHAGRHAIGIFDETSYVKKGDKTPGVKRQWCGAVGKEENCMVTVHLGYACGEFHCLLDGELFLPEDWSADRQRCREAGIPEAISYRPKWQIALELLDRAVGRGIHFEWLTFDEGYGGKPGFLRGLACAPPAVRRRDPPQFHRLAQGSPRGHTTVPSPGTWARASGSAVGCRQSPRSTCRRDAPPARIPGPTLAPLAGQGWGERADDLGGQARPVLPQG